MVVGANIFIIYCVLPSRAGGDEQLYRKIIGDKEKI